MKTFTRDLDFVNFTDKDGNEYKDLDFVNVNGITVYEAWKKLTKSGVPPITLQKCKGANLVDYKIYGESIQGKNKMSFPYSMGSTTLNGIAFDVQPDGSIICNGTATTTTKFKLMNEIKLQDYIGYTLSGSYDSGGMSAFWIGLNLTGVGDVGQGLIIEQSYADRRETDDIVIRIASGYTCDNLVIKPQLEKGAKTDWISQVITPDTPIEVESIGEKTKNLLKLPVSNLTNREVACNVSNNNVVSFEGSSTGYPVFNFDVLNIPANTSVTISYDSTNDTKFVCRLRNSVSGEYVDVATGKTKTPTFDVDRFQIALFPNFDYTDFEINSIQLEEGTNATEYEPYGYKIPITVSGENIQPVITNIYLNEPLRKIGDYVDYIDFEKGLVIRNVKEILLTGDESGYVNMGSSYGLENTWLFAISNIAPNRYTTGSYANNKELSNLLKNYGKNVYSTSADDVESFSFYAASSNKANVYLRLNKNRFTSLTGSAFQSFVRKLYNNGTPLIFYYMLQNHEEETIELPNIPTFKGTTIIEVDTTIQPSNMKVKYYGKE